MSGSFIFLVRPESAERPWTSQTIGTFSLTRRQTRGGLSANQTKRYKYIKFSDRRVPRPHPVPRNSLAQQGLRLSSTIHGDLSSARIHVLYIHTPAKSLYNSYNTMYNTLYTLYNTLYTTGIIIHTIRIVLLRSQARRSSDGCWFESGCGLRGTDFFSVLFSPFLFSRTKDLSPKGVGSRLGALLKIQFLF